MYKLLKSDIEKWEKDCKNGFKFDIRYYLYHNEKTLIKRIKLDDKTYLEVHLMFYNNYENYRQVGYYINVNISKWNIEENGMATSQGLGISYKLNDEIYQKRSFKELQRATEHINNDLIMSIYNQDNTNKKQLENAVILG